jgi:hypothetical protein
MSLLDSIFGTSQQQKTRNVPKWALPLFQDLLPVGQDLVGQQTPGATALADAGDAALSDTVSGRYLDPAAQQLRLAPVEGAMTTSAQEFLSRNLGQLDGAAARGGQLFSTKALQLKDDTVRRAADDLSGRIGALRLQDYDMERGNQVNAIQAARTSRYMPLDEALRIAQVLQGISSTSSASQTPALFSSLQQGAGSLAGILGAIPGL